MTLPADTLPAGRLRRIGSLAYDALLLIGVLFVAGLLFQPLFLWLGEIPWLRVVYQLYLAVIVYAYFGWCWTRGGQTLAMKTWRIRLRTRSGAPVRPLQALLRYLLCWPSLGLGGIGIAWALIDRDRQFLHDRLAGTRLVSA